MQKNSEFFKDVLQKSGIGLLLAAVLLTACRGRDEVTSVTDGTVRPMPSGQVTTIPRPTERPSTTVLPSTSVPDDPDVPDETEGDYVWDPYVFDRLADDYHEDAVRLADAIMAYDPSVSVSAESAKVLCDNFAFEFPPAALVDLEASGEAVEITYLYPEDEHHQQIEAFRQSVNRALSSVTEEDGELSRAMSLYDYVVKNVTYFYVDYTDKEITAFSAFTQGVTICYGFADAFGYLLRQVGMEAHLWRGGTDTANGFSDHGWCYAMIDGAYYHFDPTWEYSSAKNSGKNQYIYFGQSDARRFRSLSRKCVSGFGALETVCDITKAMSDLEIEIE